MTIKIDEKIIQDIFRQTASDQMTTRASFYNISGLKLEKLPALYVSGNVELNIYGQPHSFENGAIVFQKEDALLAIPADKGGYGNVTVEGDTIRPLFRNIHTNKVQGNIATLEYLEGDLPGQSTLRFMMPDRKGPGFSIRYPALGVDETIKFAQDNNAIVKLKTVSGETIEGFFPKYSGGALPRIVEPYSISLSFERGDFVQIKQTFDGNNSLVTLKETDNLSTVDGQPINMRTMPELDTRPIAESRGVDAASFAAGETETTLLGRISKIAGPAALAALPVFEGLSDAYQTYKDGGDVFSITASAAAGTADGVVDVFLPGARNGYSDVTGGDRTMVDRMLNAANDATATVATVGTAAMVAESAGVVTIPAIIPTGVATLAAGVANFGVNALMATLKVAGLSGAEQDGGYIYDGISFAANEVESWLGFGDSDSKNSGDKQSMGRGANKPDDRHMDVDSMLSQSIAAMNNAATRTQDVEASQR